MIRCLGERTLFLLHDGEGTDAQRIHLKECDTCATKYRQLEQDLTALSRVLRQEPPPKTAIHRFRSFNVRWQRAGTALALALLLVALGAQIWIPFSRSPIDATNREARSIVDDLPSNPFLLNEALAAELATEGSGSLDVAVTALESERPCEWFDLPVLERAGSSMEELASSEGLRPAACVEVARQNENSLPRPQLSITLRNYKMEVFQ